MKIIPIASDSLGIRSMATYVEIKDCKILIDPSAALGPKRYGLVPHQKELEALTEAKNEIAEIAEKCDILTISHYHYDHFLPEIDIYSKKIIFAKNIKKNINKSQMQRGTDFAKRWKQVATLVYSDTSVHNLGDTTVHFSPPFPHGPTGTRLGFTIMVTVEDKQTEFLVSFG